MTINDGAIAGGQSERLKQTLRERSSQEGTMLAAGLTVEV